MAVFGVERIICFTPLESIRQVESDITTNAFKESSNIILLWNVMWRRAKGISWITSCMPLFNYSNLLDRVQGKDIQVCSP